LAKRCLRKRKSTRGYHHAYVISQFKLNKWPGTKFGIESCHCRQFYRHSPTTGNTSIAKVEACEVGTTVAPLNMVFWNYACWNIFKIMALWYSMCLLNEEVHLPWSQKVKMYQIVFRFRYRLVWYVVPSISKQKYCFHIYDTLWRWKWNQRFVLKLCYPIRWLQCVTHQRKARWIITALKL